MNGASREDTVTDLIANYLRDNGINAVTHQSLQIPGRYPVEPDLIIKNEGTFVGEAKWENDFFQGIAEAHDYGQAPTVNGSFAISYENELKQEVSQARVGEVDPSDILSKHQYQVAYLGRKEGTDTDKLWLDEIPGWIDNHIHNRVKPEADPDQVIEIFRQAANALTNEIEEIDTPDLFRNVLGLTPDDTEEANAAKRAAGYLLVNQIAFYRVLSSVKEKYPDIDPHSLDTPSDLNDYFAIVLEDDYSAIFSFPVANAYEQEHLPLLKETINGIYGIQPEQIDHEILGTVFHKLTPFSVRKQIAAFYTMNKPAEILTELAIDDPDATVLDPSCGSGTLLTAAYRRKRELTENFTEADHKRFLKNDITGIDIMPFAAHLSTIHLALEQPAYQTEKVQIGIDDSTKLEPGMSISPIEQVLPESAGGQQDLSLDWESAEQRNETGTDLVEKEYEKVEKGSVGLTEELQDTIELEKVDLVIMNPPFSRQESVSRFSDDYKAKLKKRFSDYEDALHGKMSYASYFILLADKFLDKGGKLAAVLPASFLTKSSDEKVRDVLLKNYDIQYLIGREDAPNFSEDTAHREILLVAEKGAVDEQSSAYVSLNGLEIQPDQIIECSNEILEDPDRGECVRNYPKGSFTVNRYSVEKLKRLNLFSPLAVQNQKLFDVWEDVTWHKSLRTLEDMDTGLIRGIGSHDWQDGLINDPTANLRKKDVWILDEEDTDTITAKHRHLNETITISKENVVPDLHRISNREELDVSNITEYAVIEDPDDDRFFDLIDDETVPSKWRGNVSTNLEKRLSHVGFVRRPDVTAPGTRHLSYYTDPRRLYHAMWITPKLDAKEAKIFAVWMDSSFNFLQMMLHRQPRRGGFAKFEKHMVRNFRVPDWENLSTEDVNRFVEAFDTVSDTEFPPLYEQYTRLTPTSALSDPQIKDLESAFDGMSDCLGDGFNPRIEIDHTILEILDFENPKAITDELYPNLLDELVALKTMMR
jgi:hypothetical protein